MEETNNAEIIYNESVYEISNKKQQEEDSLLFTGYVAG